MQRHAIQASEAEFNTSAHSLLQRLSLLPDARDMRVIAFIAARRQEGTSTVARSYAYALAASAGKKVLIIDAGTHGIADVTISGIVDTVNCGKNPLDAVQPLNAHISQARWMADTNLQGIAGRIAQDTSFWQGFADAFDTVIIDAPSLQDSYDGIVLAAKADAALIIVEAEKTPAPVIRNLQETLLAAGTNIAGVVMNKRNYYIPARVYDKL